MGWSDYKLVCILRNVDMSPLLFPHKLVSLENVNIKMFNSNLYWMFTWSLGKIFPRPTKWPILAVSPVQNIAGVWPHSVGQVILVLWEALAGGSTGIVIRQGLVTVTWSIMSCWEANYGRNIILENHIHSISWSCSGIDRDKVQVLNRVGLKVIDGCCTLIILGVLCVYHIFWLIITYLHIFAVSDGNSAWSNVFSIQSNVRTSAWEWARTFERLSLRGAQVWPAWAWHLTA